MTEDELDILKKWLGTGSINIFGMQFSGKDSQAQRLAGFFNAPVIGGGDILRNTKIPPKIQSQMDAGEYIDQNDYLAIVTPYFSQEKYKSKPLILSSVGRWLGEEQTIIEASRQSGHPIKAVVFLQINRETAFGRLERSNRGRSDDTIENLSSRINEFESKTMPVVESYRKLGLVIEVDGKPGTEEVAENILQKLWLFSQQ